MSRPGGVSTNSEVGDSGGIIVSDYQNPPRKWRIRIKQTGGATGGGTISVSLLGVLTGGRDAGSTGTLAIEITDMGT